MKRLQRLPLQRLLPLVVLALYILMLGSMMIYQNYAQIDKLERNSMVGIKQRLAVLQGELETAIAEKQRKYAERTISALGMINEVRSLSVLDENGRIFMATNSKWKGELARNHISSFNIESYQQVMEKILPISLLTDNRLSIQSYYPIKIDLKPGQKSLPSIGLIYLEFDLSAARKVIREEILAESAIFGIVGLLFMGLLITILNFMVGRPLQHISFATQRLASGKHGIQLDLGGWGELAQLAESFNHMSTQIETNVEALRSSKRHFATTFDSIGDAVIATDKVGRITSINPVAAKMTGWSVEEAKGKPIDNVFNVIDVQASYPDDNPIRQVARSGNIIEFSGQTTLIAREGKEYQIADSVAPILSDAGEISGVVIIFRNITTEYALNSKLSQSEERFRNLVETTSDWIWEVNCNAIYTYVSPHCHEILGYDPDELIGKTPFDLMSNEESKRVKKKFAEIVKEERAFVNLENTNLHKKGHAVILETSGVPYFDQNGQLLGYRGVDQDITQRKQVEEALTVTSHSYKTLIDYAPEALAILDLDDNLFQDANENAIKLFGMTREEFFKCSPVDISPPFQANGQDTVAAVQDHLAEIENGGQTTFEWLHHNAQGELLSCEVRLVKLPTTRRNLVRCSVIDISDRKKTEAALAESEQRFRQLFEKIPNIAVQGYNQDRVVIFWNKASERLYGYSKEEAVGAKLEQLIIPVDMVDNVKQAIQQWLSDDVPIQSSELDLRHKDGSQVPVYSSHIMLDNNAGEPEMYCIDIDLTERRKAQAEIEQLAYFDMLTNLPNRRLLLDRINEEIAVAERHLIHGAILYLDLDNFKTINDSLGHSAGDALLQKVATLMENQLRSEDTVARLGGDEFVVLLKELDETAETAVNEALLVAEKIQASFSRPIAIDENELYVTTSIGISLFSTDNNIADDVLNQADTAMYRAKEKGRNNIRFFESSMQAAADARLMMEKDLRQAIVREEFCLHYQIQVDVKGKIVGVEALLRWQHPNRGLVLPDEFISVAEETGLILQIGEWVLKTACQQLSIWGKRYPHSSFHLAVNVSPHQFRMADFASQIYQVIRQSEIDPLRLTLEVTEGVVINDIKDTAKKMITLKKMGIRFSIDDFGTGYSSLTYLKRLPVDQLKIDQAFVRDISHDPNDEAIVETIITMAKILGMDVIAEGVEKKEHVTFLTEKGCKVFQGYYFDKPLSSENLADKLEKYYQLDLAH
ncbi:MAG: PAS domain S-box protein [Methylococcaceae bacterium]